MADEITANVRLQVTNSAYGIDDQPLIAGDKFTMSGTERINTIVSVTTTQMALPMNADATVPGWCYAKNLDATNYISLRSATGVAAGIELRPGEFALFPLARTSTAPYAIADTAACRLHWVVYER